MKASPVTAATDLPHADPWGRPWPEGTRVPRWVRNWRGRVRRPRLQLRVNPQGSVRYYIALYQGLLRQWVLVITRYDDQDHDTSTPSSSGTARTRAYIRPFGQRGYGATVRNHLYAQDRQDPAGLSAEPRT